MIMTFWNEVLIHGFFGVAFAILVGFPFYRFFKKRRYFLHFGGDNPMSIGTLYLWSIWLFLALIIEVGTSVLTHRVYAEFALSVFQIIPFTFGTFFVDRIFMMIEPENYYLPQSNGVIDVTPITSDPELADSPDNNTTVLRIPETPKTSRSWIGSMISRGTKNIVSAPKTIINRASTKVEEHRESTKADRKAHETAKKAATTDRLKKFHDLTEGH